MISPPFSRLICAMIGLLALSACQTLEKMPPPKIGESLSNAFPLGKVSFEELFNLAVSELQDAGVTIVRQDQTEGIILGTGEPGKIRAAEGSVSILHKLIASEVLVRVDISKTPHDEGQVYITAMKKNAVLPGDPYAVQRDFTDRLRVRVSKYIERKPSAATKLVLDSVDRPLISSGLQRRHGYAVLVGIESYRDLPKVDFAERDVEVVKEYLIKVLGYPDENIIVRTNQRASRSDLESYLEHWLERNVEPGGEIFIYYAGHGSPHPASGEPFLVPYDGDPSFLETTAYPVQRLYQTLSRLPASRVMVVLDSCFSGMGGRSVMAKGARGVSVQASGLASHSSQKPIILAASQDNQISSTFVEKQHGLFTYFLLKGLQGEAVDSDGDGHLQIGELHEYVRTEVQRQARRVNVEQTPQLMIPPGIQSNLLTLPSVQLKHKERADGNQ